MLRTSVPLIGALGVKDEATQIKPPDRERAMAEILGGTVAVYLLLRLWQWVLKKLPTSWTVRLAVSALCAYGSAVVVGAYGFASDGAPPLFNVSAMVYVIPAVIAAILETARLYSNASKASSSGSKG